MGPQICFRTSLSSTPTTISSCFPTPGSSLTVIQRRHRAFFYSGRLQNSSRFWRGSSWRRGEASLAGFPCAWNAATLGCRWPNKRGCADRSLGLVVVNGMHERTSTRASWPHRAFHSNHCVAHTGSLKPVVHMMFHGPSLTCTWCRWLCAQYARTVSFWETGFLVAWLTFFSL
ncbi:hypothetical protein PHLGIDRAFT_261242 [Phlebiopsis gigantea 11061_1 CR5-6]|uniref:Uncharacterized protein n=1 Tax=Phlebiopsis gigantea (strain 11061_1 CR5-6) TaxID=745531 RepID=A0A0C3SFR4_PHLG1|nr:hypothetical protein PHLGIDRAFT_261242 [Phlebiopsis gigantea 11061_1 CR5-6]